MKTTPVVYACIAPHGTEIIPELATRASIRSFDETRRGMLALAGEVKRSRPDTIIIASPHNLRLYRNIGIVTSENSSGTLAGWTNTKKSVSMKLACDPQLAKELLTLATRRKLPVVGVNYGTFEGPHSDMPMDWGTFVPLWFFTHENHIRPKIVIVAPNREIPLERNVAFGSIIGELGQKSDERIVFVASADQAHAHKKSGPYGYDRAAAKYDEYIVRALKDNDIMFVTRLSRKLVEDAKPDSLWQMAMLAGVAERVPMDARLYSYQVPTYFGMICAGFLTRRL